MPDLRVKATLDRSAYEQGLETMKGSAKKLDDWLKSSLGSFGGVLAGVFGGGLLSGVVSSAIGKITSGLHEMHANMVQLGKDAENIGIGTEKLEEMKEVFEHFGQSGDQVVSMFGRLAAARDQALAGNDKMRQAFESLGLSLQQIARMDPDQLMQAVAKSFSGSTGETRSAAMSILGRGLRSPGTRRALEAYGEGQRFDALLEPSESQVVTAQREEVFRRRLGKSLWNATREVLLHPDWAPLGLDTAASLLMGTPKELETRKADREKAKRENEEALRKQSEHARMVEDEKERARREEIEQGIHLTTPAADSYTRRGLLAGGAPVNSAAYQIGRRQVQLAERLLESSLRIERQLARKGKLTGDVEPEEEAF